MNSAVVIAMGKAANSSSKAQMGYVQVPAKRSIQWVNLSVDFTVGEGCSYIKMDQDAKIEAVDYEDGNLTAF